MNKKNEESKLVDLDKYLINQRILIERLKKDAVRAQTIQQRDDIGDQILRTKEYIEMAEAIETTLNGLTLKKKQTK